MMQGGNAAMMQGGNAAMMGAGMGGMGMAGMGMGAMPGANGMPEKCNDFLKGQCFRGETCKFAH